MPAGRASSRGILLVCALVQFALSCDVMSAEQTVRHAKLDQRRVYAWATTKYLAEAAVQWKKAPGLFDGVQARCGVNIATINASEIHLTVNQTELEMCSELRAAVRQSGGVFQIWVFAIPQQALTNRKSRHSMIRSAVSVIKSLGFDGLSFDDETDCAPRSTTRNFTAWVETVNELSDRFHEHGLTVSAAVQATFGIQDVTYKPGQACALPPWKYVPDLQVSALMANTSLDRWLVMDTYYFTTARFLNALDFYTATVPAGKLGVGMMNRAELTSDDYAARFHAIDKSGANWINMFMMPLDDAWLPWLRKWKSRCQGCPNAGTLSCYEPSLLCGESHFVREEPDAVL